MVCEFKSRVIHILEVFRHSTLKTDDRSIQITPVSS